jgi:uncharacterized protein
MATPQDKEANELIHETSPYLLQHAYNPVKWLPFTNAAFHIAKSANKPVLVSIGYSACHWCHVMEHESFEDHEVADLMNKHFVNIKVDREERSDVDMLYMQAVQLMTGHGGWPLNCFVMPDGKPFYGGTYFPKEQWLHILRSLADLYENDPGKVREYAGQLTQGINQAELFITTGSPKAPVNRDVLQQSIAKWKRRLDNRHGGPDKAPKFPLPANYRFLLRWATLEKDEELLKHVNLTLTKMAFGGIYDQLHGGFARYSTDVLWKVPHFEKMLYDNSQLVSLYCEAYNLTKNELYRETAKHTLDFITREWYNLGGYFYSAFDADSEGEEGKYYVWTKEELSNLLDADFNVFSRYFEINDTGYWEHGNYILMRNPNSAKVRGDLNLSREQLESIISRCMQVLKDAAAKRVRPGLDDKTVTAWNAMMCSAYAQAYLSFDDENYKKIALGAAEFICAKLTNGNSGLYRTYKNGVARIEGFLDDYAFVTEAMLNCYLISQDETYLMHAKKYCEHALLHFNNPGSPFLYYTSDTAEQLVARTTETNDNVIPSSNSQMAINLHLLGTYFENQSWLKRSADMLSPLSDEIVNYGAGYANWATLALLHVFPAREVVIVGKDVDEKLRRLYQHGITNAIFAVGASPSQLPLMRDRFVPGKSMVYICEGNACKLPVETVHDAVLQLS